MYMFAALVQSLSHITIFDIWYRNVYKKIFPNHSSVKITAYLDYVSALINFVTILR